MSYCLKCGAYIPEGYDSCLACSYSGEVAAATAPEPEPISFAAVCPNCAKEIHKDNKFCPHCGYRIAAPDTSINTEMYNTSAKSSYKYSYSQRRPKRRHKHSGWKKFLRKSSYKPRNYHSQSRSGQEHYSSSNQSCYSSYSHSNYQDQPREKKINKWVALLLCYFLGFLGAHKFYEGRTKLGFLYLFTMGLGGIGWLVDIFIILFKPNPYYVES